MFDGSSISGWKGIEASDMKLLPDTDSVYIDPLRGKPFACIAMWSSLIRAKPMSVTCAHRRQGRGLSEIHGHWRCCLFRP